MHKSKYCFFLLLAAPFIGLAQGKKDSTNLANAEFSQYSYTDSVQLAKLRFAKTSAYYLAELMPERISRASLAYIYQKGNFIPAQGATANKGGSFSTEGTAKLGTVRLFGSLTYQKIFEDSTGFAHQTRSNTTSPYYFGSPAYVHYERSIYMFDAMASKSVLQDRLSFAVEAQYKVGDHFSTNDPRGSIGEYQFDLKGVIAYRFSESFRLGTGYIHGYGREKINIGYKNPRYYESSAFPVYYNHLVNGYREWGDALTNRNYDDKMQRNGGDLFLDFSNKTLGNFYLNGSYVKENQNYFSTNSSGFIDYSRYGLQTTKINLLWLKKQSKLSYGATVNYQSQTGKDFNLLFQANNYIYNGSNLAVQLFINRYTNSRMHGFYLGLQQNSEERTDGVSANNVYYNNLFLSAGYGFKQTYAHKNSFAANLSGVCRLPLNDVFNVVQNEGYFTQYVINRDYIFNTATATGGSVQLSYGFPLFKTMMSAVAVNASYLRKLTENTISSIHPSLPGNDRFSSNVSFNLYF